mmetsp:Transcript_1057/g.4474  ORF Transcript_1057/g.4474 Transcript_1057/m.4474 type:complete len:358 (+) Transcript_1057:51-1124(+)
MRSSSQRAFYREKTRLRRSRRTRTAARLQSFSRRAVRAGGLRRDLGVARDALHAHHLGARRDVFLRGPHALHALLLLVRHLRAELDHLGVLPARHRERRAADLASLVQRQLVVDEPNVQSPLMRVQTGILHRQHPRHLVALVVVRVPPPGRRDEHAAGGPVAPDGIDDVAVGVNLFAHERVHARLGGDGEVERDGVVPVRPLHGVGRDGVEQRPEHVRQRLGLVARLVPEEHAEPVHLRAAIGVRNLLNLGEHALALEQRGLKLLPGGRDAEVLHQRLVVHPVERGAALRRAVTSVRQRAARDGHHEEVALGPRHRAVLAARLAGTADDVKRLRRRDGFGVDGLRLADAHEGRHEVG